MSMPAHAEIIVYFSAPLLEESELKIGNAFPKLKS